MTAGRNVLCEAMTAEMKRVILVRGAQQCVAGSCRGVPVVPGVSGTSSEVITAFT